MDRTILQSRMIHGNKKSNEPQRFTESFFCDEIHDNLRTLALLYPLSDDFKELFEKGMFIKPNTKAFPHIMKYLFLICDPIDFKKKFCWPIYNKAAEATFRNSTLDLLNKLNNKYELGFGEIKYKILIFPGGMEFMRVVYELTRLSMQLILKRNGIHDPDNQRPVTLAGAQKRLDDLENLYRFAEDFRKKVENHSMQLKTKTEILKQLLKKVTANTNITMENILHDKFTESWSDAQNDIIDKGIQPEIEHLIKFQNECQQLEVKVNRIFEQQTIKFDRNALNSFSNEMQKKYPQIYHQLNTIIENGRINLDHMLQALPLAIPSMLQMIESHKPRSIDAMTYELNRLRKISKKADEVLQKILQISNPIEMNRKEFDYKDINVAPQFESIQSMILSTPTISHDTIRRAEVASIQSKRISLLEDVQYSRPATSMLNIVASKNLNSILEESNRSGQKQFLSPTRLFSRQTKAKLDPMFILQSISKNEKKDKHLGGHFKPKSMNFAGIRLGFGTMNHDNNEQSILSVPDFSSTLLNQSQDVKDSFFNVNEQINTSLAKSVDGSVANDRKNRSLITTDTFNPSDINSSPSGRIEPLVTSKLILSAIKPMKLLDKQSNNENLSFSGIEPIESTKLSDANETLSKCFNKALNLINIENNQNAPNRNSFSLNRMIDENDESLLNMSDQILHNLDDSALT